MDEPLDQMILMEKIEKGIEQSDQDKIITDDELDNQLPELKKPDVRELIEGKYRIIYRIRSEERIDIPIIHHSARLLDEEQLK